MDGSLQVEPGPRAGVFRLKGELDLSSAQRLLDALLPEADVWEELWLDLEGLRFLDVAGAHAIERIARSVHRGGALLLVRPPPAVRLVLDVLYAATTIELRSVRTWF